MKRKALGLAAVLVVVVVFGTTGCRSHQMAVSRSPERCAVVFDGCGHRATPVAITAERRTLRDAFAGVGVDPVLNAGGYPVMVFVRLYRPEGEYFVATELIPGTPAGDILLNPGERVELVPWTETDLMRGLKQVTPPTVGPAPRYAGSLERLFDWYDKLPLYNRVTDPERDRFKKLTQDQERAKMLKGFMIGRPSGPLPKTPSEFAQWSLMFEREAAEKSVRQRPMSVYQADLMYLGSLYSTVVESQQPLSLNATGLDQLGREHPELISAVIHPNMLTSLRGSHDLPRIANFTLISDLGRKDKEAVLFVERTAAGRAVSFMLPRPAGLQQDLGAPVDPKLPVKWDALENALVFDGDIVTVAPPEEFPIVQASRSVSQHVIQPMTEQRKACKRLLAREHRGETFRDRLGLFRDR